MIIRKVGVASLGLSAVLLVTGCSAIMPVNYETLPVVATVESSEEETETETEEQTETETETETEEQTEETEAETEAETYAIDEGFTRVNQIVEVTENVNMRKGPGTEYDAAGLLIAPAQVERISDNGEWSQIVYSGNVYYVASEYLLVVEEVDAITKPAAESTDGGDDNETETEAETEAEAEAKETSTYSWDEITTLSNESVSYGFSSSNRDELNRPTGVLYYESLYGQYDVNFIGSDTENVVYLTMDEGYEAGYTPEILDVLKEKNVKAVFFVTKQFVTENPDLVQRMIDEGHQIGNHTCAHPSAGMPSLGMEAEYEDIQWLHDYVQENFGYEMTLFRFPSGIFSEQSLALLNYMGYTPVFWSYAHADWDTSNQPDEAEALANCLASLHPGEIFLLHAVSSTNTHNMADFIDGVRAAGYEFGVYPSNGF